MNCGRELRLFDVAGLRTHLRQDNGLSDNGNLICLIANAFENLPLIAQIAGIICAVTLGYQELDHIVPKFWHFAGARSAFAH